MGTTGQGSKQTAERKVEHLRLNLEENVSFPELTTGLERYRFIHNALPELDGSAIDLTTRFLNKTLNMPILISCMTGGVEMAARINETLAEAAETMGVAMGIGSQRAAIEHPERARFFRVRHRAPTVPLLANLGAVQLNYGYGLTECLKAVEMIEADALVLHLNPLQEMLQPEGNTNFSGLLRKIEGVCKDLPVPVIVKEVGWGISEDLASKLIGAGVTGIDVAGSGGTSWSEVEKHRADSPRRRRVAASFAGWGIPTAEAVVMARRGAPGRLLIASGGIRTGIDAAKCLALGADVAGLASPVLKAAAVSLEATLEELRSIQDELRIAMMCSGAGSVEDLKRTRALRSNDEA